MISTGDLWFTSDSKATLTLYADALVYAQMSTAVTLTEIVDAYRIDETGIIYENEKTYTVDTRIKRYKKHFIGYECHLTDDDGDKKTWSLDIQFMYGDPIRLQFSNRMDANVMIAKLEKWTNG